MSYSPNNPYETSNQSSNLLGGEITADDIVSAEEGRSNKSLQSLSSNSNGEGGGGVAGQSIWQQSA